MNLIYQRDQLEEKLLHLRATVVVESTLLHNRLCFAQIAALLVEFELVLEVGQSNGAEQTLGQARSTQLLCLSSHSSMTNRFLMCRRATTSSLHLGLEVNCGLEIFWFLLIASMLATRHRQMLAPSFAAVPAKVLATHRTEHLIASAVLLHEHATVGTPLSLAHIVLEVLVEEFAVLLQLVVVVGDLRALGRKVRLIVALEAHFVAARAANCAVRVGGQVECQHVGAVRIGTPFVVVENKDNAFDRVSDHQVYLVPA